MSTPASQTFSVASFCPPRPAASPQQDRRQLLGDCVKGSLAHLGWRPLLVTGLLRQLLIHHYATRAFIEDPDLRDAVWTDGRSTGILIESVNRWRGDLVEKRPAVLIKRNAYRNVRVALNDRYGADGQGFDHYLTLWVGSTTLFCIGGSGASCEILTTETQRELTQFGPAVRQQLALDKFQVTEVGEIGALEEATQNFVCPITVGWAYQETWKLSPEALPLQGVSFEIRVDDV